MNEVVDQGQHWPANVLAVTNNNITVTMAGENGFNAVMAGNARVGTVADAQRNVYNVRLPGIIPALPNNANHFQVQFTRQ